jgi:hypothetical protein
MQILATRRLGKKPNKYGVVTMSGLKQSQFKLSKGVRIPGFLGIYVQAKLLSSRQLA